MSYSSKGGSVGSGVGVGMGVGFGVGETRGEAVNTAKAGSVSDESQEERQKQDKIAAAPQMILKYVWYFFTVRLLSNKLFPYITYHKLFSLFVNL